MKKNQSKNQNQNNNELVSPSSETIAEKVVCGLVNRINGALVLTDSDDGSITSLPPSQCIMFYGIKFKWGYKFSQEWVRIGLYTLADSGPRIKYVVKAPDRVPHFKDSVFGRSSGVAEIAAVNWAMGGLFSDRPDGLCSMSSSLALPDKSRSFFGNQRTWQSCVDMFDSYTSCMEVENMKLVGPCVFPISTMESAISAVGGDESKLSKIGSSYKMGKNELKNHIQSRFSFLLNGMTSGQGTSTSSSVADFRSSLTTDLKGQMSRIRRSKLNDSEWFKVRPAIEQWIENLGNKVYSQLGIINIKPDTNALFESMRPVQTLLGQWMDMGDSDTVEVIIPSNDKSTRKSSARHEVFANPVFHAVGLFPMQTLSGVSVPYGGELPENGSELFAHGN